MISEAATGLLPPASGVTVSADAAAAGFTTSITELTTVVVMSDSPTIALVPVAPFVPLIPVGPAGPAGPTSLATSPGFSARTTLTASSGLADLAGWRVVDAVRFFGLGATRSRDRR